MPRFRKSTMAFQAVLWAFGVLSVATPAAAQDLDRQQSIQVGQGDLYPAVRVDVESNSNIGLLPENEVDGVSTVVRPELIYVADRSGLEFKAEYIGAISISSEDALQWTDSALSTSLEAEFDRRRRANVSVGFSREHEDLGRNLTRGAGDRFDEPVEFNRFDVAASVGYGVTDARGNVRAGFSFITRDYTNLDSVTDGLGFTSFRPFGEFSVRAGGSSRAFFQLRGNFTSFDNSLRDRDQIGVFLGLRFNATGRLSGSIGLGLDNVTFASDAQEDDTLFVVESNLRFQPTSFAAFTLDINREINNQGFGFAADGQGDSIETLVRLGWDHEWSSRVSSRGFVSADIDDEVCPTIADSTVTAGFELNLALRRWLEVGAAYTGESRSTSSCGPGDGAGALEYDRQLVGVHVRATL